VGDDARRRQWAGWVASQVGGDEWRQRTALEAAMQALQTGRSSQEAAAAARAAVGVAPVAASVPATQQAAPMAPAGVYRCRFCGSIPAAPMTVYEHNGFIFLMTFKNLKGPFCRDCGLHTWRRMTDTTLLRGWLGMASFFIAPITVLINVVNLRKLTSLPPPDTTYAVGRPADPGSGMFRRFGIYVYAGVLVVLLLAGVLFELLLSELANLAGR
jgi:hypothetical protein